MNSLKIFLFFFFFILSLGPSLKSADSAPPAFLTYQGYLVDSNGTALGDSAPANYDVVFRIYDVKEGGTTSNILWAEQQTVTVDKGYFSILLGEGSQVGSEARGDLRQVFQGGTASDRFIGLTVSGVSGSDLEIAPRLRLLPSPYSFTANHALSADRILGVNSSNQSVDLLKVSGENVGIGLADGVSPNASLDVQGDALFRSGLTVNGDVVHKSGLSVGKSTAPTKTLDVSGNTLLDGTTKAQGNVTVSPGYVRVRPASGDYALRLHPPSGQADYELRFSLNTTAAKVVATGSSRNFELGAANGTNLTLEPGGATIAHARLTVQGSDFVLGTNDGRSVGDKPQQRALVHDGGDVLVLNYNGDFEGGVTVGSDLTATGDLKASGQSLYLDSTQVITHASSDQKVKFDTGSSDSAYIFNTKELRTNANMVHPVLALDSTGSNDRWNSQAAEVRIGEGAKDNNSYQTGMIYRGDGWGSFGSGQTSDNFFSGAHILLNRNDSNPMLLRNTTGVKHETSGGYARFGRSDSLRGGSFFIQQNNSNHGSSDRYYSWNGDSNWDYDSDRRLKKDIQDERPLLEDILKVKVRQFKWIDGDEGASPERGVIAQEVEPLFPELVSERDHPELGESKMVGYSSFGLIAVKGIQELKAQKDAEIAELQQQNQQLLHQMNQMESALEELRSRLQLLETR